MTHRKRTAENMEEPLLKRVRKEDVNLLSIFSNEVLVMILEQLRKSCQNEYEEFQELCRVRAVCKSFKQLAEFSFKSFIDRNIPFIHGDYQFIELFQCIKHFHHRISQNKVQSFHASLVPVKTLFRFVEIAKHNLESNLFIEGRDDRLQFSLVCLLGEKPIVQFGCTLSALVKTKENMDIGITVPKFLTALESILLERLSSKKRKEVESIHKHSDPFTLLLWCLRQLKVPTVFVKIFDENACKHATIEFWNTEKKNCTKSIQTLSFQDDTQSWTTSMFSNLNALLRNWSVQNPIGSSTIQFIDLSFFIDVNRKLDIVRFETTKKALTIKIDFRAGYNYHRRKKFKFSFQPIEPSFNDTKSFVHIFSYEYFKQVLNIFQDRRVFIVVYPDAIVFEAEERKLSTIRTVLFPMFFHSS